MMNPNNPTPEPKWAGLAKFRIGQRVRITEELDIVTGYGVCLSTQDPWVFTAKTGISGVYERHLVLVECPDKERFSLDELDKEETAK